MNHRINVVNYWQIRDIIKFIYRSQNLKKIFISQKKLEFCGNAAYKKSFYDKYDTMSSFEKGSNKISGFLQSSDPYTYFSYKPEICVMKK